ncbi:hypothetical protein BC827DRAFT_1159550 [Russula dissimulans]|nr:hypothetical protein BC827DRAFT_1159550 [Russula dissimulans]
MYSEGYRLDAPCKVQTLDRSDEVERLEVWDGFDVAQKEHPTKVNIRDGSAHSMGRWSTRAVPEDGGEGQCVGAGLPACDDSDHLEFRKRAEYMSICDDSARIRSLVLCLEVTIVSAKRRVDALGSESTSEIEKKEKRRGRNRIETRRRRRESARRRGKTFQIVRPEGKEVERAAKVFESRREKRRKRED